MNLLLPTRPIPHDHEHQKYCHTSCPVWKAEDLAERRALYQSTRRLYASFESWFTERNDWESLAILRKLQQEHPTRWPRR